MKKNNLLIFTISVSMLTMFSCAKKNVVGYFHNNYESYTAHKEHTIQKENITPELNSVSPSATSESITTSTSPIVGLENTRKVARTFQQPVHVPTTVTSKGANENISLRQLSKEEKKELKKEIKRVVKQEKTGKGDRSIIGSIVLVIIALVLPPLAVLVVDGLSGPFWLSILLTILFWVPGVIYALWRIFKK